MKEKYLNTALSTVLLCIDAVFLYIAFTAREYKGAIVGPFDFTKYLGIALAALCVITIVQSLTAKEEDKKVVINNLDLVFITIAATALLLILWKAFGIFYLWGFLYVFCLLTVYSSKGGRPTRKSIVLYALLSAAVLLVIYVLFKVLMGISL